MAMSPAWNGCRGSEDTKQAAAFSSGMEPRLKSAIVVKALVRRCDLAAIGVAVVSRGDPDAGAILIKLSDRHTGCSVLTQTRRPDGTLVWMRATGPASVVEDEADGYIARQRQRDPDLWVVEVESGAAEGVLDAPIIA
jgi:GMP synthase (glutamine-hydrolysing)